MKIIKLITTLLLTSSVLINSLPPHLTNCINQIKEASVSYNANNEDEFLKEIAKACEQDLRMHEEIQVFAIPMKGGIAFTLNYLKH